MGTQRIARSARLTLTEFTDSQLAVTGVRRDVTLASPRRPAARPANRSSWRSWLEADGRHQIGGGSTRSIVSTWSMDRSKETIVPTPVLSAHATR